MSFQEKERVRIINNVGVEVGEGTIVSINNFREPSAKYAIDADFYKDDYLFVGEENLKKIQEETIND